MSGLKSLVKDTAVYGLSSMVGRFLNWLLTYIYVRVLLQEEMGQMSNLYAWVAVILVVITLGMETTFFRFINKSDKPREVYGTALMVVGTVSLLFLGAVAYKLPYITQSLGYQSWGNWASGEWLIAILAIIVALDAFCSIPLAYLRYAQRPWRFMLVRMGFVAFTIVATLGLFYLTPHIAATPEWLVSLREEGLLAIFGINLLGAIFQILMLAPTLRFARWGFDRRLIANMLTYALPIMLLGLVGAFNNQIDKIIFPLLFDNPTEGQTQLGIYSACYKIAVIMVLFTQAFRYAYDPFVFAKAKEGGDAAKAVYAQSMKYYLYFTLFIFLAVVSALDIVKYFVTPAYYIGLPAVPLVMLGQLMFGVYFNLSLWYKLTDKTYWGAILSVVGCLVLLGFIVFGAKAWGFMACAWGLLASNAVMMLLSYALGQRYYPIAYPLKPMLAFTALALALWAVESAFARYIAPESEVLRLGFNFVMLSLFVGLLAYRELPLKDIRQSLLTLARRRKKPNNA